jgi:undecaprenyl-diphosphatase
MMGATTLALWKGRHELAGAHLSAIAIGFAVSFIVALVVVRWFVGMVARHGFTPFAWYRIVIGGAALAWYFSR